MSVWMDRVRRPSGEDDGLIHPAAAGSEATATFHCLGGFDGRGLAAALAMGADGINMGTRFMVTKEAPIHKDVKQAMVNANELDTALIYRSLAIRREYSGTALQNRCSTLRRGPARQNLKTSSRWQVRKVKSFSVMRSGRNLFRMVVGLIDDIPTCEELVARIVAREAIISERLTALMQA